MSTRDKVLSDALSLPPDDRAFVANAIELSLTKDGFATPEIAAAWMAEIEHRLAAYDKGELKAVPAGVAVDQIRRRLAIFRAGKVST